MFNDNIPETPLLTDDQKMIAELLKDNWSLGIGKEPTISYRPESYITNARYAAIYVYNTMDNISINTTDYRTLQKIGRVGIKVSCRFWDAYEEVINEVTRILLANRRAGKKVLGGYTYLEISDIRPSNDSTGWYLATIDIKLTSFNTPIRTAGFGDKINKSIDCG